VFECFVPRLLWAAASSGSAGMIHIIDTGPVWKVALLGPRAHAGANRVGDV